MRLPFKSLLSAALSLLFAFDSLSSRGQASMTFTIETLKRPDNRLTLSAYNDILILEAVKPYFNFVVLRIVCGIPEITIQGTPEDWERLREKAGKLRKHQLDWWIDELDTGPIHPVLPGKGRHGILA